MGLMFFHHDKAGGQYYVRQADIPKGVITERVDVPTDAKGLAIYLSAISQPPLPVRSIETVEVPDHEAPLGVRIEPAPAAAPDYNQQPVAPREPAPPKPVESSSQAKERALQALDVEDHIHNAAPERLAVLAAAVCWRIKELSNGCNLARGAEPPLGQPQAQGADGEPLA